MRTCSFKLRCIDGEGAGMKRRSEETTTTHVDEPRHFKRLKTSMDMLMKQRYDVFDIHLPDELWVIIGSILSNDKDPTAVSVFMMCKSLSLYCKVMVCLMTCILLIDVSLG